MTDTEIVCEPGRQDIVISRVFDAPRELVFQTVTDPGLVSHWWGPRRFTTEVDAMDVRRGGLWRYLTRNTEDGNEYAFRGVFHDVVAPERIVGTFEFEPGGPGCLQLGVQMFEEVDGGTRYRNVALFQSVEDRDGWAQTGMEQGIRESMDLLEELIQSSVTARG